ncbi:MAG TPA: ABC transporter substrate-binding protein [Dehalococcoidia bacterium]|nr:ABC transporter substrate-binding protein [Dehalococcoidia bacterium]
MSLSRSVLRWLFLALAVVSVLALAACSSSNNEKTPATTAPVKFDGTVKIGMIAEFSGNAATPNSPSQLLGAQKAARDINDAGGIKIGGKAYQLEIVTADTRSESVGSVAGAQTMIDQNIKVVYDGTCQFWNQAYEPLKAKGNTLVSTNCPLGLNRLQFEGTQAHPLLFATIDFAEPIIIGWLKMVQALYPNDIKSVSSLLDNGALGAAMAPAVQKGAQQMGLTYAPAVSYPVGQTDFSSYVTNMKAAKVDMVYSSAPGGTTELPQAAMDLQMTKYLVVPGLRPFLFKNMKLNGGVIISADWRVPYTSGLTPPNLVSVVDSFGKLAGNQPPQLGFAVAFNDWIWMLKQAMEQAGTTDDMAAVAKALVGQKYNGPFGTSETMVDHSAIGATGIVVFKDDKATVYIYADARQTKPVSTFGPINVADIK